MKIIPYFPLLFVVIFSIVLMSSCSNPGQPVQANTAPPEVTAEVATFSLSNLSIRPADSSISCDILNIGTDEEIIISVVATNTDISQNNNEIVLYIDMVEVETVSVSLGAGDSEIIEFTLLWGNNEEGIYTVTIGELQAIFGVG